MPTAVKVMQLSGRAQTIVGVCAMCPVGGVPVCARTAVYLRSKGLSADHLRSVCLAGSDLRMA